MQYAVCFNDERRGNQAEEKEHSIIIPRQSVLTRLNNLIQLQNHRTLVMWALGCAKATLEQFEAKYPQERRPRICLEFCEAWARGKMKMLSAKQAVLDSHAVAKEINDSEYSALCHAIGHAGATVHIETHALGLPFYELTAIVLKCGKTNYAKPVLEKIDYYYNRLLYWAETTDKLNLDWLAFLLDDSRPNKKKSLYDKRRLNKKG